MSFVICCATSEYGIIAGDGRVVETISGRITDEKFPKVHKLTNGTVVGICGDVELCCHVVNALHANVTNDSDVEFVVYTVAKSVEQYECKQKDLLSVFFILGKDREERIVLYMVRSKNERTEQTSAIYPKSAEMPMMYYGGSGVNPEKEKIMNFIAEHGMVDGCIRAIQYVSTLDDTVNGNVLFHTVQ